MKLKDLVTFEVNGKKCVALVRKLTERECGRLMAVDDEDITKIQNASISRSAQYKLYGNSIVKNVLSSIFYKLLIDRKKDDAQMDLFAQPTLTEEYNHEHPLRVMTLCSGYGSQELSLEWLKQNYPPFDYTIVGWSEYDPETPKVPLDNQPAVKAYKVLHPEAQDLNYGDMTKINWAEVPDFDLLFYSTPCQSISQAGLQHGFVEGSGTRSSIIWNVRDAIKIKQPKYAILENVSAMVSGKFVGMFNLWQRELEKLGYSNHAQLLNSKEYGLPSPIPQNRERIFLVSVKGEYDYHFPKPTELTIKLKDLLEDNVDTKYYLNPEKVQEFVKCNMDMIEQYAREDEGEIEKLPKYLEEWLKEQ